MNISESLQTALAKSKMTKANLAQECKVTPKVVSRAFRANGITVNTAVEYLNHMGCRVYAIPDTIDLQAIFKEAIQIDSDKTQNPKEQ